MALLRQRRSLLSDDDGPCPEIREDDLVEIRRKYLISPFVGFSVLPNSNVLQTEERTRWISSKHILRQALEGLFLH